MYQTNHQIGSPAGPTVLRRGLHVVGLLVALVLVAAAAVAGWFGVERFVLADGGSTTSPLGAVGSGLPTERLDRPEPWRRFELTTMFVERDHRVALDLDAREMRFRVMGPDTLYDFVAQGDVGHDRTDGDWNALTADETAAQSDLFGRQDVGPYLLTDILPPAAVPHTTVHSDSEIGELRVFDVSVDEAAFWLADPLGHGRWLTTSGEADDGPARRTIHVRPDGYVVRVDREGSTRVWTELIEPILQDSPLAEVQVTTTTDASVGE